MPALVSVLISLFSPSGAVRPTTASTCCAIRYCAHAWAALASYLESHHTYWTCRPLMPPEALTDCMYARTVSRSTDESTGPLMSKKPPIVIDPLLTPDCDWLVEPVPPPVGPFDWLPLAPDPDPFADCAPATSPPVASVPPRVNVRTVMTPSTDATTTAPARRATAMRSLMLRATKGDLRKSKLKSTGGRQTALLALREGYARVPRSTQTRVSPCAERRWRGAGRHVVRLALPRPVGRKVGGGRDSGPASPARIRAPARLRGGVHPRRRRRS